MRVRKGDGVFIEHLMDTFRDEQGLSKFVSKIFGEGKGEKTPMEDLYPLHEALRIRGNSRESVEPLKKLLESGNMERDMRTIVLCRAAITALEDNLPLDLRPILGELGMRRRSASESLRYSRMRRERKEGGLAMMEKSILASMIAMENSDIVESEKMRRDLLITSDMMIRDSYEIALRSMKRSKGEEFDIWSYHLARIKHLAGRLIFDTKDAEEGIGFLRASLDDADKNDFRPLVIRNLLLLANLVEDEEEALRMAGRAIELTDEIGNQSQKAEGLHVSGYRKCLKGEGEGKVGIIIEGADQMLNATEIISKENEKIKEASYLTDAAVWLIRGGEERRAMQYLREASALTDRKDEEELFIRIKCAYVYGLFSSGKGRKAKKALMHLITHYPVKHYVSCFNLLKEAVEKEEWLKEDPDTAELFHGELIYKIEKDAVEEIITRAKEAYPNEFGAMLRGVEHITHIEPVLEGAGGRTSFVFSLFSRFSQRNVEGEGVVHSHPSGSARPSRADLSMFGRFPGINIIIAYPFRTDSMAAYDRLGNRVKLEIVK